MRQYSNSSTASTIYSCGCCATCATNWAHYLNVAGNVIYKL